MRINFAKPRWCCKEQWSEFFLLLKCSVTWLSFLSPPCVVMRSKLTSGCSFAETGQVILSAEIMKRKYIWEGKSYWGCLPKVWVLSKCLVCWNTCCCFVLKGNGWNTDVLNQIYPLSLVAAIIYRAISTLLWYLHLWKGIVKHNCGSEGQPGVLHGTGGRLLCFCTFHFWGCSSICACSSCWMGCAQLR